MKELIIENNLPTPIYLAARCVEKDGVDKITLDFYDKTPLAHTGQLISIGPNNGYSIELNNPTTFDSHWYGRPVRLAS